MRTDTLVLKKFSMHVHFFTVFVVLIGVVLSSARFEEAQESDDFDIMEFDDCIDILMSSGTDSMLTDMESEPSAFERGASEGDLSYLEASGSCEEMSIETLISGDIKNEKSFNEPLPKLSSDDVSSPEENLTDVSKTSPISQNSRKLTNSLYSQIQYEIKNKNYKRIKELLNGASPEFVLPNGHTILSYFVVLEDLEGIKFCIDELKCDVNYKIYSFLFTDFALKRCRSPKTFKFLIQNGADPNARIDYHLNLQHFTLLHYAVVNKFAWIVKELIEAGADDSIVDNFGHRASEVAQYYGNKTILEYFKNKK